jgi:hypothetical protein
MRDTGAAVARHPDALIINAAVQLTAALVLRYKGHQGVEDLLAWGREIVTAVMPRLLTAARYLLGG